MGDRTSRFLSALGCGVMLLATLSISGAEAAGDGEVIDASSLRGKVLCGYQGWFRCPGDRADMGWVHWSRDSNRISPQTLSFEMWPDVAEYPASSLFRAPGFTDADGKPARLFTSDDPRVVDLHFNWMKQYGIDGVWLQRFAVDLPGGPLSRHYESRQRVTQYVAGSAQKTGRAWAIEYDLSGLPAEKIVDVVSRDWDRLVDEKWTQRAGYIHENSLPVVMLWGFYPERMKPADASALLDVFKKPGPGRAFVIGGGSWDWRDNADANWQRFFQRLDGYSPWNVGNVSLDEQGIKHASMARWPDDRRACHDQHALWLPVVYPGFSWDNLAQKPAGTSLIPRRNGQFLWEQFRELKRTPPDSAFVAMFDEVDEGTAIFKVAASPPAEAHFVNLEAMPSDGYLRLTGAGGKLLRGEIPDAPTVPK